MLLRKQLRHPSQLGSVHGVSPAGLRETHRLTLVSTVVVGKMLIVLSLFCHCRSFVSLSRMHSSWEDQFSIFRMDLTQKMSLHVLSFKNLSLLVVAFNFLIRKTTLYQD
jgi:hypothetical protein